MPHMGFHVFVASKVSRDPRFIFGNIFPDMFDLLKITQRKALDFSRHLAKNKSFEHFYNGVRLHFVVDDLFHPTYIRNKSFEFQKKFKIFPASYHAAHFFIELALDNIVKKQYPYIEKLIRTSTKSYGEYEMAFYMGDYFHKDPKKILKVMEDSYKVIEWTNPLTAVNIFKMAFLLKHYFKREVRLNLINIIGILIGVKFAESLVKKDYNAQIRKVEDMIKKQEHKRK